MKCCNLFWILLFLSLQIFAQNEKVLELLDKTIEEQRRTLRRLEKFDFWELKDDVKVLKENLDRLRSLKMMFSKAEASQQNEFEKARELKENTRTLYKRLASISLINELPKWKSAEQEWLKAQYQNPESLTNDNLTLYRDKMENLFQELKSIESLAEQKHEELLSNCQQLYEMLTENPWSNRLTLWTRVSRTWEKTWERRQNDGIEASGSFATIYKDFLRVQSIAQEKQQRSLQKASLLLADIENFFKVFEKISFAQSQERGKEYWKQWLEVRDMDLEALSPQQAKQLELDLFSLRSGVWNYKLELEQKLQSMYREAENIFNNVQRSPWTQLLKIYPEVVEAWQTNWENKLNIPLEIANALEKMHAALRRLQENAEKLYHQEQANIIRYKELNGELSEKLSRIEMAKQHNKWVQAVNFWKELQYSITATNLSPNQAATFKEKLSSLNDLFLQIERDTTKKIAGIFEQAQTLYQDIFKNTWAMKAPEWEEIQKNWEDKWQWKTEIPVEEVAALEKILTQLQKVTYHLQKIRNSSIIEATALKRKSQTMYEEYTLVGQMDPVWPEIQKNWEALKDISIEDLSPQEMENYFAQVLNIINSLEKMRPRLKSFCIQMFHDTQTIYDNLLEDNWINSVPGWEDTSREWIVRRPLKSSIEIKDGALILEFRKKLSDFKAKIREFKDPQFRKTMQLQKSLSEQYQRLNNFSLVRHNYRWKEVQKAVANFNNVDFQRLDIESLANYEKRIETTLKQVEAVSYEAENNLSELWASTRKLYAVVSENPMTRSLIERNDIVQQWDNYWRNITQISLQDGEKLQQLRYTMENCWPFWWRPFPPKSIEQTFLQDVKIMDIEEASVPIWAPNSRILSFQTSTKGQMAIHLFDIANGQKKVIEFHDRTKRWASYYSWSLSSRIFSFCAKKLGFHELLYIEDFESLEPFAKAITDSPDFEKDPTWCQTAEGEVVFFLQGKHIYYSNNLEKSNILPFTNNIGLQNIEHLSVYSKEINGIIQLAICGQLPQDKTSQVYLLLIKHEGEHFRVQEVQKISQNELQYFAPSWSNDGQKIAAYTSQSPSTAAIVVFDLQNNLEKQMAENIRVSGLSEQRFKGPEFIPGSNTILCCTQGEKTQLLKINTDTFTSESLQIAEKYQQMFQEAGHFSISKNHNYLAWTFLKENEGRKLAVAVINVK